MTQVETRSMKDRISRLQLSRWQEKLKSALGDLGLSRNRQETEEDESRAAKEAEKITGGGAGDIYAGVRPVLARMRNGMIGVGIFSFFVNGLVLVVPLYSLQLFDRVLSSRSYDTLYLLSIVAVGMLAVQSLIDGIRGRILSRIGLRLEDDLKSPVLAAMIARSAGGGRPSAQGLRDLSELRQVLTSPAIYSLFDAPWVPFFLLVLFLLHPVLGVLAVAGLVFLTIMAVLNMVLSARSHRRANEAAIQGYENVQNYVRNAEAIQSMGMLPAVVAKWNAKASEILFLNASGGDQQNTIATVTKFFRMMLQIGVMGTGVALVLDNQLTPGGMIASSILLGRVLQPVEQAVGSWKAWANGLAAWRRIQQSLFEMPAPPSAVPLPRPEGRLTVKRLSFGIGGLTRPIVRGVEFELKPGEVVGIIGPSGSGKSTLARLMVGVLKPTTGEVQLDGANVAQWNREELGAHIGYLPQDIQLFPGTIRENIARMSEGHGDQVLDAAKKAGIHDMILGFPDGYETEIGTGGVQLSGGQEQRIGLARALFRNPALVILDEPDSHLDPSGHESLLNILDVCRKSGQTVVMVTHRPGVLTRVSRLIVLREGAVERDGPAQEILAALRSAPLAFQQQAAAGQGRAPASGGNMSAGAGPGGQPAAQARPAAASASRAGPANRQPPQARKAINPDVAAAARPAPAPKTAAPETEKPEKPAFRPKNRVQPRPEEGASAPPQAEEQGKKPASAQTSDKKPDSVVDKGKT